MIEEKYGRLYLDGKLYKARSKIGSFMSSGMRITVYVMGAEMNKEPHFHLISEDKSLKCCVGIYKPIYVPHKKYKDRLSNQQIEDMIAWLKSYEYDNFLEGYSDLDNWHEVRWAWNTNYGNHKLPEPIDEDWNISIEFPDYIHLM